MPKPAIITLRNESEYKYIDLVDLLYVRVDDYLSSFYFTNNQKFTCTKSLLEVVSILPETFEEIRFLYILVISVIGVVIIGIYFLPNLIYGMIGKRRIKRSEKICTAFRRNRDLIEN